MAKKKIRSKGDIMLDMEKLLEELTDDHDMQWHEVLFAIFGWLMVHRPGNRETYTKDGSHPEFYYGHKDGIK